MKEKMDLFSERKGAKMHSKVSFLLKDYYEEERKLLSEMFEGFVDRDHKIVNQFQETFHSTFWEIYLYSLLKKCNFEIDWTHEHPDFIITAPDKFYIEAVTSNKRFNKEHDYRHDRGGVWEITKGYKDPEDYNFLMRESISRNYYKIRDKIKCYNDKYKQNDWFDENLPYIVALGSYCQENYGREYIFPLLALLYGQYYLPSQSGFSEGDYVYRLEEDGADEKEKIPLGIFYSDEYADVSAIIYSSTVSLGKLSALCSSNKKIVHVWYDGDSEEPFKITSDQKEKLTDGLFVFHNPFAKTPLSKSIFEYENICQFFDGEDGVLKSKSPHAHLVGRAVFGTEDKYHPKNLDKLHIINMGELSLVNKLKVEADYNYNYYIRNSERFIVEKIKSEMNARNEKVINKSKSKSKKNDMQKKSRRKNR
ncbi:hypothetical protein QOP30_002538 [Salmonella enterica]|nr:hypothetical protein [Salmonella enterica subsp. diarizonae]EAQ2492505.1 hypothetical protein [Salmonella enterica]ECJ5874531.1 hypothetical protein [Salmonella enterica subsp. salamae]EGI5075840.1 hypothetical protein [Salmonella enterica subsp. enterica serovar Infantis]EGO1520839.1 hypothetical protein [Salmonella enterica subsp. diarizonae serovar 60:r:e,n,x,z15]EKN5801670.1 hypothetical protein [Salmonella enterica subsp. enterica]